MEITWEELTVPVEQGASDMLSCWRWLTGQTAEIILVSTLGDAFLQEETGAVYWLSAGSGSYTKVADSLEDFQAKMVANVDEWFLPELVACLLIVEQKLGPNQCYGYKHPPVLGGQYDPDNFEPTDLHVHFSILGQVHEQVKDLPPGTKITDIEIEGPQ